MYSVHADRTTAVGTEHTLEEVLSAHIFSDTHAHSDTHLSLCVCVRICMGTEQTCSSFDKPSPSPHNSDPPALETAIRWRVEESVEGRGAM